MREWSDIRSKWCDFFDDLLIGGGFLTDFNGVAAICFSRHFRRQFMLMLMKQVRALSKLKAILRVENVRQICCCCVCMKVVATLK